jgi:hypothetical protein
VLASSREEAAVADAAAPSLPVGVTGRRKREPRPGGGLTLSDCARRYRCSRARIRQLIACGELVAVNLSLHLSGPAKWIITPDGLAEFERRRTSTPLPKTPRRKKKIDYVDYYPD